MSLLFNKAQMARIAFLAPKSTQVEVPSCLLFLGSALAYFEQIYIDTDIKWLHNDFVLLLFRLFLCYVPF